MMPFFYAKLFHFKNGANNSVLMDNEMNFAGGQHDQ